MDAAEFQHERLLIFTEHRDTLEHLQQRFEALGYTGQIAAIHGGMDVEERERQRIFFMPRVDRRRQNISNPDAPSARIMLATERRERASICNCLADGELSMCLEPGTA